jgi:hypothetical protein
MSPIKYLKGLGIAAKSTVMDSRVKGLKEIRYSRSGIMARRSNGRVKLRKNLRVSVPATFHEAY